MRPETALRVQAAVAKAWAEGQAEYLKGMAAVREILASREVGEQPEARPQSVIGACPFCERVPCEDHAHKLWRLSLNGADA